MNLKDSSEFDLLDFLNIVSLAIGIENLELNISQENLDNQTQELDRRLRKVVDDIHAHLKEQDSKIDMILEKLNEKD